VSKLIERLKAAERERAARMQARTVVRAREREAAQAELRRAARARLEAEADAALAAREREEAEEHALAAAEARRSAEQSVQALSAQRQAAEAWGDAAAARRSAIVALAPRHPRPVPGALAAGIAFGAGIGSDVLLTSGSRDTPAAGRHAAAAPEPLTPRLDADFETFGRRTADAADR
jgi:hypothetical protein